MKFYSTADKSVRVRLREAVLGGMPADKGLYMPEFIPRLPESFLDSLNSYDYQTICLEIATALLGDEIPQAALQDIIYEAINFDTPLVNIEDRINALELFHGPTLAFKDVGARFMSRLMAYLNRDSTQKLTILVATSGDTGSAVANGFFEIPGIDVVVLYPADKISLIQEKQIATLDKNITALKIAGNFDDCQRLVKTALADSDLLRSLRLTSANSINISRLIPQIFYYFNALRQIGDYLARKIVISVPSGNFGNLTAGLIAKKMGLPVQRFIAGTNINHVVPDYLTSGVFEPRPSIQTISNAMDVGNPSNFARILDLYHSSWKAIQKDLAGAYYSDDETRRAMAQLARKTGYVLDPHGAVAYLGLSDYLAQNPQIDTGIFLETAHPAKFNTVVEPVIGEAVEIPRRLQTFLEREARSISMSSRYSDFKEFLLSKNN
ncbi:MAG: threonine synthase [Fidelibacterota bacterium]